MELWLYKAAPDDSPPPESIPANAGDKRTERERIGKCRGNFDMGSAGRSAQSRRDATTGSASVRFTMEWKLGMLSIDVLQSDMRGKPRFANCHWPSRQRDSDIA
jgi:hypothetical protein